MTLRATDESIRLITSGTSAVDYTCSYADLTAEANGGNQQGQVTAATTTTIVSSFSGSEDERLILEINLHNAGGSNQTITVLHTKAGTDRRWFRCLLKPNETAIYSKGEGWKRYNEEGELYVVAPSITVESSGGGGLTPVIHSTDTNIVATKNTAIYIPSGTLTANRTIDISDLDTDGDRLEIYNHDTSGNLFWEGSTEVYVYETLYPVDTAIPTGSVKIIRIDNKNLT